MVFIAFYFWFLLMVGLLAQISLAEMIGFLGKSWPKEDIVMRKVVNSLLLGVALIMVGYAQPSSLMSLRVSR
ncbi:hypothetical protein AWV80_26820 [Cupriavidus sp. UYMU48A]|nr:hypothetical protein AWV80_26820 [Cupriavidus sp. UYMU48A]